MYRATRVAAIVDGLACCRADDEHAVAGQQMPGLLDLDGHQPVDGQPVHPRADGRELLDRQHRVATDRNSLTPAAKRSVTAIPAAAAITAITLVRAYEQ